MIDKIKEYTDSLTELAQGVAKGVNNVLNGRDINDPTTVETDKDLFKMNKDNPVIEVNDKIIKDPKAWNITTETASAMYKLKDEEITIGTGTEKQL